MIRNTLCAAVLALFVGCVPTLYSPNMTPAPLLREAGEIKATLGSDNAQLAYAPTENLSVVLNGFYRSSDLNTEESTNQPVRWGWLAEAGAGPHGSLLHPDVRWEALAGVGYGRAEESWDRIPEGSTASVRHSYRADGVRAFVQPNIGYVMPYFEAALSLRLSGTKYVSLATEGYSAQEQSDFGLTQAAIDPLAVHFEPGLTVKAGYKWVKAYVHYSRSLQLAGSSTLGTPEAYGSVGLSLDLAQWFQQ